MRKQKTPNESQINLRPEIKPEISFRLPLPLPLHLFYEIEKFLPFAAYGILASTCRVFKIRAEAGGYLKNKFYQRGYLHMLRRLPIKLGPKISVRLPSPLPLPLHLFYEIEKFLPFAAYGVLASTCLVLKIREEEGGYLKNNFYQQGYLRMLQKINIDWCTRHSRLDIV